MKSAHRERADWNRLVRGSPWRVSGTSGMFDEAAL
jgi:hypothetical protein